MGDGPLAERITGIQGELYLAMAEIASANPERGKPPAATLPADATARLEALIDSLEASLPPLKEFVLPGASRASAALHLARTVCRRAERDAVAAGRTAAIPASVVVYLNRLSDLLFVMARAVDHDRGGEDRTFKSALE